MSMARRDQGKRDEARNLFASVGNTMRPVAEISWSRQQQDDELIGFLQRYLGYCLTGHVHEHVLAFFFNRL
jgi:hypothetical protein